MRDISLSAVLVVFAYSIPGCNPNTSKPAQTRIKPVASAVDDGLPADSSTNTDSTAVEDNDQDRAGPLLAVTLRGSEITLSELANANTAERVKEIDAHSAGLTEADMAYLADFPRLEKLTLNVNSKITDDSLQHLSRADGSGDSDAVLLSTGLPEPDLSISLACKVW